MDIVCTREQFLADLDIFIDPLKRYLTADINFPSAQEEKLYPIMGSIIKQFGEILGEDSIETIGVWMSKAWKYKFPIVVDGYDGLEEYTYITYTKEVIMLWLYPLFTKFNYLWNEQALSLEQVIDSLKSQSPGNFKSLKRTATPLLEQLKYFQYEEILQRRDF